MSVPVPLIANPLTHLLEVLVRNEGKSELGATPEDTSGTTFPESPEPFFSIWTTARGNGKIRLAHGGCADKKE
jgi:hypothetical protein